jgi:hypothetical protein
VTAGRGVPRSAPFVALLALLISCGRDAPSTEAGDPLARDTSLIAAPAVAAAPVARESSACVAPDKGSWEAAPVGAATFEVNRGTRGMSSQLRWLLSPDSAAILVIDDPNGVENEPVPDAVFYATERTGRTWRMDSVWSAAPSPDWKYLAVGRAVVIVGGPEQHVPAGAWNAPAQRLRELARVSAGEVPALSGDSLRAHSYAVSGMAVVEGAAATLVLEPSALPAATPRFVSLDGWRVGWSCDARSVLVGGKPVRAGDDETSATTRRAMISAGAATTNAAPDAIRWSEGPSTTIGVPTPVQARTLRVRNRSIESRAGRVLVRQTDGAGQAVERDVGPGVPLAATRGGHFILALAPRAGAPAQESSDHAVVYRVP